MEDIMRLANSEAMLFKYGSGTGTRSFRSLRSTREKLSGGGRPSGPLSFLKVYDQVANVVKSGGKTRRAAKMNTLKDWHRRHRRIHRREAEGREESLGVDRAGLRRQLQRRRLRLRHVPERKSDRARERRIHERRDRGPRMVDAPGARRYAAVKRRKRARCCAKSPKARGSAATRDAVRRRDSQMAHLQRHRADKFHQSVLGICLSRQHGLQSRVAELDEVQDARMARSMSSDSKPRSASSSPRRKSSSITPVIRSRRSRKTPTFSARSVSATRTSARSS